MAVWLLRSPPTPAVAVVSPETPTLTPQPTGNAATTQSPPASVVVPAALPQQLSLAPWTELQRGSLVTLIAELRAKNFPPVAVRAVVNARSKADLASEYRTVCDALAAAPYWRGDSGLKDPVLDHARRVLDREVDDRATQLLGPAEAELSPELRAANKRMYGDLPPDKLNQLMRINADYADIVYQVRAETRGFALPEDAAKLRMIWLEQQADIDRLLTPEQRQEYDYHGTSTANRVRSQLVTFNPTEAEFQAIFKVQRTLDVQFGSVSSGMPADQLRQRDATERQLEAKLAETLGPSRYAEYREARRAGARIKR